MSTVLVTGCDTGLGVEFARQYAADGYRVIATCLDPSGAKETAEFWFKKAEKDGTIAPQRKLANEKPKGETVDYDALIKSWPATPPKRASLQ